MNLPYVGESAFAHKAGLHVDALRKNKRTYEHVEPELVGNERRFLISELSGKSNILAELEKAKLTQDKKLARKILERVQELENEGYQFEAANASFDLLIKKTLGTFKPSFELIKYHVDVEKRRTGEIVTEATVKLKVGDADRARRRRGGRPGERAGCGTAQIAGAILPAHSGDAPDRLQGPRGQRAVPARRPASASSSSRATSRRSGGRWASRRTSSRQAGSPWWTASSTSSRRTRSDIALTENIPRSWDQVAGDYTDAWQRHGPGAPAIGEERPTATLGQAQEE